MTVVKSLMTFEGSGARSSERPLEPPGPEPVSRYMTSVPLVALIVWVPDDVQLLLNVEPPVKVIVSAISWVHW